jgi:tyrosinase
MVDKVWWDWQEKSKQSQFAYGGGSVAALTNFTLFSTFPTGLPPYLSYNSELPGDGLWKNVTVWDVMDTTGDKLCYVYA